MPFMSLNSFCPTGAENCPVSTPMPSVGSAISANTDICQPSANFTSNLVDACPLVLSPEAHSGYVVRTLDDHGCISQSVTDTCPSELSVQSSINCVVAEMERRNNLGYGLGIGLGRFFGTRTDYDPPPSYPETTHTPEPAVEPKTGNEKANTQETTQTKEKQDDFASEGMFEPIKSTLTHAANTLLETATRPLRFCFRQFQKYENVRSRFLSRKKALHIEPAETKYLPSEESKYYNDVTLLHEGYSSSTETISDATQICDRLFEKYQGIKFDLVTLAGKGNTHYLKFGPGEPLASNTVEQKLRCLPQYLHNKSSVIFQAQKVGDVTNLPYYKMLVGENVQLGWMRSIERTVNELFNGADENLAMATYNFLSKHVSDIEVSAPGLERSETFVQQTSPIEAVTPDLINGKRAINSHLIFNANSVKSIRELRFLEDFEPKENLLYSVMGSETEQKVHEEKVESTIQQLKFSMRFQQNDERVTDAAVYGMLNLDANKKIIGMSFYYAGEAATALASGAVLLVASCVLTKLAAMGCKKLKRSSQNTQPSTDEALISPSTEPSVGINLDSEPRSNNEAPPKKVDAPHSIGPTTTLRRSTRRKKTF